MSPTGLIHQACSPVTKRMPQPGTHSSLYQVRKKTEQIPVPSTTSALKAEPPAKADQARFQPCRGETWVPLLSGIQGETAWGDGDGDMHPFG